VPPTFSRFRRPHTQSALLVLLLVVILSVTGILTYKAHDAAKGQRQAFERAVHINAIFAAEEYGRTTSVSIANTMSAMFKIVTPPSIDDGFQAAGLIPEHAEHCQCQPEDNVMFHFAYDFQTRTFKTKKATPSSAERDALQRVLEAHPTERLKPGWKFAVVRIPQEKAVYGYAVYLADDSAGTPLHSVGFKTSLEFLKISLVPIGRFNTEILQDASLPKSPTRFAITVLSGEDLLISGGATQAGPRGVFSLSPAMGSIRVEASVNPEDHALVAGTDVPTADAPLIALMVLAILLTGSAMILLKRQSELAQLRSDFVANVSHEFRTPLAQIRMFTETLLLGRVRNDAERRRSLEVIDQEAKRLTALVENVLTLGRTDRNALKLTPAATELAPMVREVVEPFAQLPRSRNIEFKLELEPRLIATVDHNAFRQILLNLLDNAVKYGPAGQRVYVGLAMFEHSARLWVDDEGPGIAPRERERVFEPFFRSAPHVDGRIAGSGIGLAIVRELAASLGGSARAEAAPGGGARLVVEFPEAYLRAEEAAGGWAVA
jgi:signal transduction histidine kinase